MSRSYRAWIASTDGSAHVDLAPLLGGVARSAGQGVIDLRGPLRPAVPATGRSDPAAVFARCQELAASLAAPGAGSTASGAGVAAAAFTLNLSGHQGAAWGDDETLALCRRLAGCAATSEKLQQLWLHHLPIGDASCDAIAELLTHTTHLSQLHLSDSKVTVRGLVTIATAARRHGCGQRLSASPRTPTGTGSGEARGGGGVPSGRDGAAAAPPPRRAKLYVNVRHLGGREALEAAAAFADCCLVRLFDAGRVGDRLASAGVIGRGKGGGRGAAGAAPPQMASPGKAGSGKGEGGKSGGGARRHGGEMGKGPDPYGAKGGRGGGGGGSVLYTSSARGKGGGGGKGAAKGGGPHSPPSARGGGSGRGRGSR